MKDQQTQNQFIELRAQGWRLTRIAAELHVAKSTLMEWNRAARQQIRDLKDVEVEALHERVLVSYELELQRLTAQLTRIEAVPAKRNLECLSTESPFVLAGTVRAQLRRMSNAPLLAGVGVEASPTAASTPAPTEVPP